MKFSQFSILIGLLTLLLSGCSVTDSTDVETSGIAADIKVYTYGDGKTTIDTRLTVGNGAGGTHIKVVSPDSLTAQANGDKKAMSKKSSFLGEIYYQAKFNTDSVNDVFMVSFNRATQTSAPSSTVLLPDAFTITSINETVSSDEKIRVAWSPALGKKERMYLKWEVKCGGDTFYETDSSDDDGDRTVVIEKVLSFYDSLPTTKTTCNGTVTIERRGYGSLDPNYGKGGSIVSMQRRKASFTVVFNPDEI